MAELACALIFIAGWLAMAGYMNYKIWLKPDDIWQLRQENQRPAPAGQARWLRRILHLDPLGLTTHRGRFIWFERFVAGVVLLLGIAMVVAVIVGQVGK